MDDPDELDENYVEGITALGVKIDEERQIGHQCTWVCHFEQPSKDDGGVERMDEKSGDLTLSNHLEIVRKENLPTDDSFKPKSKTSSHFVCPFYNRKRKQGRVLPF